MGFFSNLKAANSAVGGRVELKFDIIRDFMVVLLTCKNEEDPIKVEGARMLKRLYVVVFFFQTLNGS